MNKKYLLFMFIICSTVLAVNFISAADAHIFTDVSDAKLLIIDNVGNTNATGWLAENGVKLSDTYCALTGCTYSGNIVLEDGFNVTLGTGGFFVGDGSLLTNLPGIVNHTLITFNLYNSTWDNRGLIDSGNLSMFNYVNAQDVIYNDSAAAYTLYVNTTAAAYTDAQIAASGGMDFTNLALTNITNTFDLQQVFTLGLSSAEDIILNTTKSISWDDGGSISGTAGVITYKAGV